MYTTLCEILQCNTKETCKKKQKIIFFNLVATQCKKNDFAQFMTPRQAGFNYMEFPTNMTL